MLFVALLVFAGAAFAAESDWDAMARKAEEAVKAVQRSQADEQADAQRLLQSFQDVFNVAAAEGNVQVMEWLRKKGAQLNAPARDGLNPVHAAARSGNTESLDWLRQRGADVTARTQRGETAAHHAADNGDVNVLDWLNENGVNLQSADDSGVTPVDRAARRAQKTGDADIVDWLKNTLGR